MHVPLRGAEEVEVEEEEEEMEEEMEAVEWEEVVDSGSETGWYTITSFYLGLAAYSWVCTVIFLKHQS